MWKVPCGIRQHQLGEFQVERFLHPKLCLELGILPHHHGAEFGRQKAQVVLVWWCTSKLSSHKIQILRIKHLHLEVQILFSAAVGQKPSHLPHAWFLWLRHLQNHHRLQIQRIAGVFINFLDVLGKETMMWRWCDGNRNDTCCVSNVACFSRWTCPNMPKPLQKEITPARDPKQCGG